ncbi:DUF3341 domain-containing protein [Hymenobacter actinosclerus]|uniref:Quinol:cytochrome c oxidoreductase membrane protein n=1 Tax=Hymenobacter actinosclerus TaxID=82805 RepID=A0A1I0AUN7_9BACT|nr:DUF3341 domain-containing protein [Hymenobacter actinosclerus]SES98087.1 quinol:cytochrome c oxidoreductase membrane protein [Hymenobacter actinosclerus]
MTKRFALGIFDDEDVLLHAVENVREAGVKIYEVFTPFPIHGIDDAMGIERSRLPIAAFFFGLTGLAFALWLQIYTLGFDWPMIIGGKPHIALPAFIPVAFELTVLFCCHGMVITFYAISKLYPRWKTPVLDVRSTDDKFVMAIEVNENTDMNKLTQILRENGASEVNQKEMSKF